MQKTIEPIEILQALFDNESNDKISEFDNELNDKISEDAKLLALLLDTYPDYPEFIADRDYPITFNNKPVNILLRTSLFKIPSKNGKRHYHTYTPLAEQGSVAKTLKTLHCKVIENQKGEPSLQVIGIRRGQLYKIVKAAAEKQGVKSLINEEQKYPIVHPDKKCSLVSYKSNLFFKTKALESTTFFIQEYIEGEDGIVLNSRMSSEQSRLTLCEFLNYCLSLLEDLQLFHSNSLIHGDIKPDNIIYQKNGDATLIDFGSSRGASSKRFSGSAGWVPYCSLKQGYITQESEIAMLGFALLNAYEPKSLRCSEERIGICLGRNTYWLQYPQLNSIALDGVLKKENSQERVMLHELLTSMVDDDPAKRPDVNQCLEDVRSIMSLSESQQNSILRPCI